MDNLTSWSFADHIRGRIDVNRTHSINYYHPSVAAEPLDSGTTHLSVQSPDGAAVAVTSTVNSLYDTVLTLISDKLFMHLVSKNVSDFVRHINFHDKL